MSPRASETLPSPVERVRLSLTQWRRQGRIALRRIAGRQATATLFIDADGVAAWPDGASPTPARHASFTHWAEVNRGSCARIVLSGKLLHSLRLVDLKTKAEETLHEMATQRFALYHGAVAERWPVALATADDSCFACALHGLDLSAIVAAASLHEIDVASAVPLWAEALTGAMTRAPALATMNAAMLLVVEHSLVTCLRLDSGQLVDVQQRFLDAADLPSLADLVDRLAVPAQVRAGALFIAGWGLDGIAGDVPWRTLGRLDGRADDAGWLVGARLPQRS